MNNLDPKAPSRGLGDSIAKVTHALGIDKLADKVAKALGEEDCGCERRREALNDLFPYTDVPEEEYIFTQPRLFEILIKLDISDGTKTISYIPGERVLIDVTHPLYKVLKKLLHDKAIKKVD